MAKYFKIQLSADDVSPDHPLATPTALGGAVRSAQLDEATPEEAERLRGWNDETAARFFLSSVLSGREEKELRALTSPDRPELVPDMQVETTLDLPLTDTRVVKFAQTSRTVPIFGAAATVEIDGTDRRLVGMDATLTDAPDVSPMASISAADALRAIAAYGDVEAQTLEGTEPPVVNYFLDGETDTWHLVYYFREVAVIPPEQRGDEHRRHGHGLIGSPRERFAAYDYLVDAHSAEVVFYFSSQPRLDVPTPVAGNDAEGVRREVFGLNIGTQFELRDPLRSIETYDFEFGDIDTDPVPTVPIRNPDADFADVNRAAISAHYHATKVFDFYNGVLKRNGVDDKGMALVSLVNVTSPQDQTPPSWSNAVWWQKKMWYGQESSGDEFDSYARYFDVIAHELTHGVTESTSNLVYRNQSGALNESFSDIFGIMVKNWYPGEPNPVSGWNWEIGQGLGGNGLPLRDMQDPTRTGDPDHMDDYLHTNFDNGGVHTNSNIHNKAAYNVITAVDTNGDAVFTPQEAAILYYLTLTRLTRLADFSDCFRVLLSVASTYYSGNPVARAEKQAALRDAYQGVGIT